MKSVSLFASSLVQKEREAKQSINQRREDEEASVSQKDRYQTGIVLFLIIVLCASCRDVNVGLHPNTSKLEVEFVSADD